ncbi:MAG: PqqD family protein [Chitinophagaceae bacterium]|nr:PqqD family protein [Chitinophagaceae bacterium]
MSAIRYQRVDTNLLVSQLAGETVLMNTVTGDYFGINTVGTKIWNLLTAPATITSLVESLVASYDIAPDQCENEVNIFLKNLESRKLLVIV